MATDSNALVSARALEALGDCGDESAFGLAVNALDSLQPNVRKAAAGVMVRLYPEKAISHLIQHLNDDDNSVRQALADSLGRIGELALNPLVEALSNPSFEDGALLALAHLPAQGAARQIRVHAKSAAQTALHYHGLALGLAGDEGSTQLLRDSLHKKGYRSALNALRALGLVTARATAMVAVENLRSRDPAQRANALETLESIGEREIIRPLLVLWESGETSTKPLPENWLLDLLDDPCAWLRACAVMVAAQMDDAILREKLKTMCHSDPDETVRAVTKNVLLGDAAMETLATLSLMERILFLRRVPLFADLPPADLKQVAAISSEMLFADGQIIARQGDPGSELYILASGEVRVLMITEGQKEPREVARRHSGDYVGEMSIISQEPRIATLVADGTVRALCISQKQFEGILRERPETSLALMRSLCQRLKEASEQVAMLAT
jgi:HEAT repeat protein